jgi:hypothetical protein
MNVKPELLHQYFICNYSSGGFFLFSLISPLFSHEHISLPGDRFCLFIDGQIIQASYASRFTCLEGKSKLLKMNNRGDLKYLSTNRILQFILK